MRYLWIVLCLAIFGLEGGVFLEKPPGFNVKAATVGCCFLHYKDKILLVHRQDNKAEGNRWGIPGGKLNSNESLIDAIAREVYEETGLVLDKEKMHYIGKLYIRVPNFDFEYHMLTYLPEIENPGAIKINFEEHKGFTWVTPKDALKMNLITDEDICFEMVFGLTRTK